MSYHSTDDGNDEDVNALRCLALDNEWNVVQTASCVWLMVFSVRNKGDRILKITSCIRCLENRLIILKMRSEAIFWIF